MKIIENVKNFMETPFTWGSYFKLVLGCFAAYGVFLGGLYLHYVRASKKVLNETKLSLDDPLDDVE